MYSRIHFYALQHGFIWALPFHCVVYTKISRRKHIMCNILCLSSFFSDCVESCRSLLVAQATYAFSLCCSLSFSFINQTSRKFSFSVIGGTYLLYVWTFFPIKTWHILSKSICHNFSRLRTLPELSLCLLVVTQKETRFIFANILRTY